MENIKLSKSLRELIKKSNERFVNNIYFNPKKRKELRRSFVESQNTFLALLEKPIRPNSSLQDVQSRAWTEKFLDQMTRMVDLIDNVVPRKLKEYELTNSRFELFIKKGSKYTAIKCNYDKGIPKKHYRTCLLIPFGFPRKGKRTKAQMIRGNYDLKGFELKDKGIFTQKHKSFQKAEQTYRGKVLKIKFELTQRGKIIDNNWLKVK